MPHAFGQFRLSVAMSVSVYLSVCANPPVPVCYEKKEEEKKRKKENQLFGDHHTVVNGQIY